MEISEKVAYLKGLAEGLNLDTDSKEGKLIAAIIDVLDDMAEKFAEVDDELCDVEDGLDAVSDDLSDVEETLYFALDDDEDDDEDDEPEDVLLFFFTVFDVPPDLRFFFFTAFSSFLSSFAMLSRESLRTGSPHMFFSNSFSSPSMRFCSFDIAESVGQYCARVFPSMLDVLYILPLYWFLTK